MREIEKASNAPLQTCTLRQTCQQCLVRIALQRGVEVTHHPALRMPCELSRRRRIGEQALCMGNEFLGRIEQHSGLLVLNLRECCELTPVTQKTLTHNTGHDGVETHQTRVARVASRNHYAAERHRF